MVKLRPGGMARNHRLLIGCGLLVTIVVIALYPASRSRHIDADAIHPVELVDTVLYPSSTDLSLRTIRRLHSLFEQKKWENRFERLEGSRPGAHRAAHHVQRDNQPSRKSITVHNSMVPSPSSVLPAISAETLSEPSLSEGPPLEAGSTVELDSVGGLATVTPNPSKVDSTDARLQQFLPSESATHSPNQLWVTPSLAHVVYVQDLAGSSHNVVSLPSAIEVQGLASENANQVVQPISTEVASHQANQANEDSEQGQGKHEIQPALWHLKTELENEELANDLSAVLQGNAETQPTQSVTVQPALQATPGAGQQVRYLLQPYPGPVVQPVVQESFQAPEVQPLLQAALGGPVVQRILEPQPYSTSFVVQQPPVLVPQPTFPQPAGSFAIPMLQSPMQPAISGPGVSYELQQPTIAGPGSYELQQPAIAGLGVSYEIQQPAIAGRGMSYELRPVEGALRVLPHVTVAIHLARNKTQVPPAVTADSGDGDQKNKLPVSDDAHAESSSEDQSRKPLDWMGLLNLKDVLVSMQEQLDLTRKENSALRERLALLEGGKSVPPLPVVVTRAKLQDPKHAADISDTTKHQLQSDQVAEIKSLLEHVQRQQSRTHADNIELQRKIDAMSNVQAMKIRLGADQSSRPNLAKLRSMEAGGGGDDGTLTTSSRSRATHAAILGAESSLAQAKNARHIVHRSGESLAAQHPTAVLSKHAQSGTDDLKAAAVRAAALRRASEARVAEQRAAAQKRLEEKRAAAERRAEQEEREKEQRQARANRKSIEAYRKSSASIKEKVVMEMASDEEASMQADTNAIFGNSMPEDEQYSSPGDGFGHLHRVEEQAVLHGLHPPPHAPSSKAAPATGHRAAHKPAFGWHEGDHGEVMAAARRRLELKAMRRGHRSRGETAPAHPAPSAAAAQLSGQAKAPLPEDIGVSGRLAGLASKAPGVAGSDGGHPPAGPAHLKKKRAEIEATLLRRQHARKLAQIKVRALEFVSALQRATH